MDYEEFVRWTELLVELGRLAPEQAEDVRSQRALFDDERRMIEHEFAGRLVGFVAEQRFVADRIGTLLDDVVKTYGFDRQVYFESIGPQEPR